MVPSGSKSSEGSPGRLPLAGCRSGVAAGEVAFDKGFVISDHCDWPGLLQTIAEVKPEQVLVTHGFKDTFARYLNENGQQAALLQTSYGTEDEYAER